jgi:hypothetical protein
VIGSISLRLNFLVLVSTIVAGIVISPRSS